VDKKKIKEKEKEKEKGKEKKAGAQEQHEQQPQGQAARNKGSVFQVGILSTRVQTGQACLPACKVQLVLI
jgi:hypothetical protein